MAYVAPTTITTGQQITAAYMNQAWRDNEAFLRSAHGCKLYSSTATISSPATATDYAVAFNAEALDTDAFHSTVTNNTRITIATGFDGQYAVGGVGEFAGNATGFREARIRKNGTVELGHARVWSSTNAISHTHVATMAVGLVAGDYLELIVWQNSGGGLAVNGGAEDDTQFWAYYLGS